MLFVSSDSLSHTEAADRDVSGSDVVPERSFLKAAVRFQQGTS